MRAEPTLAPIDCHALRWMLHFGLCGWASLLKGLLIVQHQRESIQSLETACVPAEELVRKRVKDPGDFEWLKQCRFYWRDDKDTVIISICDRSFEYSFEYLGEPDSSLWVCAS